MFVIHAFLLFLIIVCVYILVSYKEGYMNEWMMKERSEYSTSYTNREDYSKYNSNTMLVTGWLMEQSLWIFKFKLIHNHYWNNNCFTDSIESSFDWFDSPSQVKRKKKAKAKNNQNFDTMMSNEFSFIFISTLDFRHTVTTVLYIQY